MKLGRFAVLALLLSACASSSPAKPQPNAAPRPYYPPPQGQSGQPAYGQPYAQPYAPQGQPPYSQPYAQPQYPPPGGPPQTQPIPQPNVAPQRPLLGPLVGMQAWQSEVRGVLGELIASLSADKQVKVRGIPLVFDPSFEVNAFAGCDDGGAPFLAGTAGILETIDAISQTRATDEIFGTQTYNAYANTLIPQMLQSDKARPALPANVIAGQYLNDPRRVSRAHEIFDEIVAFTFGHELAHHYLGHTGCANGQAMSSGPNPAQLGNLVIRVLPWVNQFNEGASDFGGVVNAMEAGRARRPNYAWTEKGGLMLLDFFARLDASGQASNPVDMLRVFANGFSRTHPNSAIRIPLVQQYAQQWRAQHPG